MFVLFVDIRVKPGFQSLLETTYTGVFLPAISSQPGFGAVELLRANRADDEYRLGIAFESHALQQKWVASELHQRVWSQIEAQCADYSVVDYTSI